MAAARKLYGADDGGVVTGADARNLMMRKAGGG